MSRDDWRPGWTSEPAVDGWQSWELRQDGRFNGVIGPMRVRVEGERVRVRIEPTLAQANLADHVHGGATLTLIDNALFIGARLLGPLAQDRAVTADLTTHFVGAGRIGDPLDALVEVTRATGRTVFLRGRGGAGGPCDRRLHRLHAQGASARMTQV